MTICWMHSPASYKWRTVRERRSRKLDEMHNPQTMAHSNYWCLYANQCIDRKYFLCAMQQRESIAKLILTTLNIINRFLLMKNILIGFFRYVKIYVLISIYFNIYILISNSILYIDKE